jgi:hypothetical protein
MQPLLASDNESSASKCFFFRLSFIKHEQDFFLKRGNLATHFTTERNKKDIFRT